MAELVLAEVDINYEKGEGLTKLDEQIQKLKDQRAEMVENTSEEMKKNSEYEEQLGLLDQSISKHEGIRDRIKEETGYQSEANARKEKALEILGEHQGSLNRIGQYILDNNTRIDDGTGKARDMNAELGKDANKNVNISTNPSIADLNRRLGESVTKRMNVSIAGATGSAGLAYASGTSNHPGGSFIAGEAGWELGRLGNRWEMLNFGMYDRPQGYEVFPHDESKRILNALNNVPGYVNGARPFGETNRIIDSINNNDRVFNQTVNIYSPEPTSPAENARRMKQASMQLAMEGSW